MAQHADFSLTLWSLNDLSAPVHTYKHYVDTFTWRIHRGLKSNDYQLAGLSRDQRLKLWPIDKTERQVIILFFYFENFFCR